MHPDTRSAFFETARIRHFDRDLRTFTADELLAEFGSKHSGRLVITWLVRNLAFQCWERIQAGTEPEVQGNIRTFWYRWVKPVLLRVPADRRPHAAPDEVVSDVLVELIEGKRLMRYRDFGFTDENWRNRGIGLLRPHVLVFAEKAGHIRLLLRLHKRLGVSFLTLGGAPSACTSELTAEQLLAAVARTKLPSNEPFHLIGVVDYDPSGGVIARALQDHLRTFGLTTELQTPVRPEVFSAAEIAANRYPAPRGVRTQRWVSDGGGLGGEPYALSVEALPIERLEALVERAVLQVCPQPVVWKLPDVPTDDPRWQRAIAGPGGVANVVVLEPGEIDMAAMALVEQGKRIVIVQDGAIIGAIGVAG